MRESLTVLAILLIVVLTTALVGPYLVDWNAHRGEIEKRLSTLVGAQVAVGGPIDVKLLPRPIFRLQNVSVSADDPRDGMVTAARVDMELSLTALMRGEILFVDADVTTPIVTLPVGHDGTLKLPHVTASDADRISLVHIGLREGTLALRDAEGRPAFTASGIAGEGEATSLAGPFKFNGSVDTAQGPLAVHLATGVLDGGKMRFKATVDASAGLPKTDFDGIVTTTTPGGQAGVALGYDGSLVMGGAAPFVGTANVVPWRLTSKMHAVAGRVELSEGELRAGADGRALIATLTGSVLGGDRPTAHLVLHARQADIGRLAVPPDQASGQDANAPTAPAAGPASTTLADDLAVLNALAGNADLTAALPIPVTIEAGLETVAAGSLTLVDLTSTVTLAPGQPLVGTLSVAQPDGSRLTLDGAFEPGPAAVYKGRVDASLTHFQRFIDDLAQDLPATAAAIRAAVPFDTVGAVGVVDLSGIGLAAHDVEVSLDRSKFAGTVTLTRGVGADHARLFADLTSDALDLDALPDWRPTAKAAADLDVSLTLVAHALRIAPTDTGSLSAGRIALGINKVGSIITLDRLSLADIGGATAEIKGRSDGAIAHAEGRLDARNLSDFLAVVERLVPGAVTDRLRASAGALSPALLTVTTEAQIASDGGVTPTLLTVNGTAAATKVSVDLRPDEHAGPPTGGAAAPFALRLKLDAPDTGSLLRQAGLAVAPSSAVGRGHFDLTVRRDRSGTSQGSLSAALGDTMVAADGGQDATGHATGRLTIKGSNMAPLARALLLASPEAGAIWPVDAAGTLTYAERRVAIQGFSGKLVGTAFKADLGCALPSASLDGSAVPACAGTLGVDRLPLTVLAGLVLGPLPAPKAGALWTDAPLAPALLMLPRSDIALTVSTLPLIGSEVGQGAKATLRLAPGTLTLGDLTATLGTGRIAGTLTLRRDGGTASLAGHVEWSGLPIGSPSLGGVAGGALDIAGTGSSAAATIASLGGSGTLAIDNARLPRFDPTAILRVIAGVDASESPIDDSAIAQTLGQELDHGAMALGTVTAPVTVATGVLRVAPVRVQTATADAEVTGSLDMATLLLSLRTTASLRASPKDWVGAAPRVGAIWKGPFAAPAREIDAATLVNGIAARAIARDQARIEAFQDDIRERAFFARRLRAIEAEQQAVRDKAKADADAADRLRVQQLIQSIGPAPTADATRPADQGRVPLPARRPSPTLKPLELH